MSIQRTTRTLRWRTGYLCCCLGLSACGETQGSDDDGSDGSTTTSTPTSTQAGSNTSTTTGATSAGPTGSNTGPSTSNSTAASTTTASGGSGGGASITGTTGASLGGAAGADGSTTTAGTGGTGAAPSDCSDPYTGPIGGPREGGPEMVDHVCNQVTDEEILARYKDLDAKVPQGLYWEPPGILTWWGDACSRSPEATLEHANDRPIGDVEAQLSSDQSYEVSGCFEGSRRVYSDLNCDYFNGTTLPGNTYEELAYLASLLWWIDNGNLTGAQILGYVPMVGGATDLILMCTIRTSFGDFGLCDQITLEQTMHGIAVDGTVTLGETDTVRTIEGTCN